VAARSVDLDREEIESSDFVMIVTHHDGIDWDFVVRHAPLVIDTRNATHDVKEGRDKIVKA